MIVGNNADVSSELQRVPTFYPREIVDDVLHWSGSALRLAIIGRIKDKSEKNVIRIQIASLAEGLSR